jgi:hypothetical protein
LASPLDFITPLTVFSKLVGWVKKYVYDITLTKLVNKMSMATSQVLRAKGKAKITVELPDKVQLSSPPFGGHYYIECTEPGTNMVSKSGRLSAYSSATDIERSLS